MNTEALQREIAEVNEKLGWRETEPSFAEAMMLVVTECAEAVEAWRSHGFETWTVRTMPRRYCQACGDLSWPENRPCRDHPDKHEGVGSEFADIAIRLLDDLTIFNLPLRGTDRVPAGVDGRSLPEAMFDLVKHAAAAEVCWNTGNVSSAAWQLSQLWQRLRAYADHFGIDLDAEIRSKIDYNRTREYRHGGKRL